MTKNLRGRARLRGKQLDTDCYRAKISKYEYGPKDNRKFCYGLMDMDTECVLRKCIECGAFIGNVDECEVDYECS